MLPIAEAYTTNPLHPYAQTKLYGLVQEIPQKETTPFYPHSQLITPVSDRPGHDRRYAIDPTRISTELGWQQRHSFEEGLAATVRWYLEQRNAQNMKMYTNQR